MIKFIKNIFTKKEVVENNGPHFYEIREKEITWLAKKIIRNKKMYVKRTSEDQWLDYATLHFIVNRLNYERLDKLIYRPLYNYENHYYYKAGMAIREKVKEYLSQ